MKRTCKFFLAVALAAFAVGCDKVGACACRPCKCDPCACPMVTAAKPASTCNCGDMCKEGGAK